MPNNSSVVLTASFYWDDQNNGVSIDLIIDGTKYSKTGSSRTNVSITRTFENTSGDRNVSIKAIGYDYGMGGSNAHPGLNVNYTLTSKEYTTEYTY